MIYLVSSAVCYLLEVWSLKLAFGVLVKTLLVVIILCFSSLHSRAQEIIEIVTTKDQPIIRGELNGKKAFFLVDTGADITILNEKDVKRYKIRCRKSISKRNTISGVVSRHENDIMVAINANLHLGNYKMDACFKVMDLTNIKVSIGRDAGVWINGIIGSDMMKKYHFIIDYGRQEIRFTHRTFPRNTCL